MHLQVSGRLCNLREVVGLLEQLEQPVRVRGHDVVHTVLWFNQFLFNVFRRYVVYLAMENNVFASIGLEGLTESMKNLSRDSRSRG
jgi:hypothetical protein